MAVDDTEKKLKKVEKQKKQKYESEIMDSERRKKPKKEKRKKNSGERHSDLQNSDSLKKHKADKRPICDEKDGEETIKKTRKISESTQQSSVGTKHQNKRMRKRKDKFKDKVPDFLRLLQTKPKSVEEEPQVVPKTPEEIAQEKMKAEKRERMRKKRLAKKENKGKIIESTVAKDAALQYLSLWNNSRQIWRFQKVRQVWLLAHMYETDKISDTNFDVLLKYLEDLKGNSKDKTIEQAEKILSMAEEQEGGVDSRDSSEEEDKGDSSEEQEEEETAKKKRSGKTSKKPKEDVTLSQKYQRARQVLQILT